MISKKKRVVIFILIILVITSIIIIFTTPQKEFFITNETTRQCAIYKTPEGMVTFTPGSPGIIVKDMPAGWKLAYIPSSAVGADNSGVLIGGKPCNGEKDFVSNERMTSCCRQTDWTMLEKPLTSSLKTFLIGSFAHLALSVLGTIIVSFLSVFFIILNNLFIFLALLLIFFIGLYFYKKNKSK